MQRCKHAQWSSADRTLSAFCLLHFEFDCRRRAAQAPAPRRPSSPFDVEQEGEPVTDPVILGLIQSRAGMPLSIADVRESITHLISLTQYEDVQVYRGCLPPAACACAMCWFPCTPWIAIEFRGTLGVSEDDLRRAVVERFGARPAARADEVARSLQAVYRDRGYMQPMITPRIEITHKPDRASMVLDDRRRARAHSSATSMLTREDPADRGAFAGT